MQQAIIIGTTLGHAMREVDCNPLNTSNPALVTPPLLPFLCCSFGSNPDQVADPPPYTFYFLNGFALSRQTTNFGPKKAEIRGNEEKSHAWTLTYCMRRKLYAPANLA
jgi:hypothetical protein